MPIPEQQLQQLRSDLDQHEARLSTLRAKMTTMQEEAGVHETVLTLGRNSALISALNELYDSPQLADEMSRNPSAYLARKGCNLPPGGTLQVQADGSKSTAVEAHFDQGNIKYKIVWDRSAGFTLTQK